MSQADQTKEWLLKWVLEPKICPVHQVEMTIDGDEERLWKVCQECLAEKLKQNQERT